MAAVTRLGLSGVSRRPYGDFSGREQNLFFEGNMTEDEWFQRRRKMQSQRAQALARRNADIRRQKMGRPS